MRLWILWERITRKKSARKRAIIIGAAKEQHRRKRMNGDNRE